MDAIEQAKEALRDFRDCAGDGLTEREIIARIDFILASLEHLSEARNARGVEGGECICPTCGLRHGTQSVDAGF